MWAFTVNAAGHVIAGGAFTVSGSPHGLDLTRYDGSLWIPLSASAARVVHPNTSYLYVLSFSGGLYIGGDDATVNDEDADLQTPVARWDRKSGVWTELLDGSRGSIRFAWAAAGSELHFGGVFFSANMTALRFTSSWSGLTALSSELILLDADAENRITTLRWERTRDPGGGGAA